MRGRLMVLGVVLLAAAGCVDRGPLVAFLGDSLTSGWKLEREEAYPALVARALRARGRPIRVLDAGVSGDTVARGLARLPAVLEHRPAVLVVALGINDGLRGLPLEETEAGLRRIVEETLSAGVHVLLVGVRIPPTRGAEHARRFAEVHPRIAAEKHLGFVPDLLQGVSGEPELLFADQVHPNAAGQTRLAANILPHLELVLAELEAGRGGVARPAERKR